MSFELVVLLLLCSAALMGLLVLRERGRLDKSSPMYLDDDTRVDEAWIDARLEALGEVLTSSEGRALDAPSALFPGDAEAYETLFVQCSGDTTELARVASHIFAHMGLEGTLATVSFDDDVPDAAVDIQYEGGRDMVFVELPAGLKGRGPATAAVLARGLARVVAARLGLERPSGELGEVEADLLAVCMGMGGLLVHSLSYRRFLPRHWKGTALRYHAGQLDAALLVYAVAKRAAIARASLAELQGGLRDGPVRHGLERCARRIARIS